MKQTSVEWLMNEIYNWKNGLSIMTPQEILYQAKELEKQQIIDAWIAGYNSRGNEDMIGGTGNEENEYYTETYETE